MRDAGWAKTDDPDAAALILVNSCGFIEPAKKESIDAVLAARQAHPRAKIVLAGCLAERYADDLAGNLLEADAFFGNGDLSRLPELVDRLFPAERAVASADAAGSTVTAGPAGATRVDAVPVVRPPQKGVCAGDRPELFSFPRSAYVKITEGCDNRCSFCAIPIIRGSLRSRTVAEIVAECAGLVAKGAYELNLIGQDLASYGRGEGDLAGGDAVERDASPGPGAPAESPLARLLRAISSVPGNFRVRLLYLHPDNFPRDILPVMTADARFYPYFDIPFQSGARSVLPRMNRRGTPEAYLELVSDVRAAFAAAASPYGTVALRTTFLVGFPGETDADFAETLGFCAKLQSMWSGAFPWSREDGTAACDMKGRVAKKVSQARVDAIREAQNRITPEVLAFFMGKTVEVLVEEVIPGDANDSGDGKDARGADGTSAVIPASRLALGRAWFQAPEVDGSVVLQYEENQRDLDGKPIGPGSVVEAVVMNVNGIDLEAVAR